MWKVLERKMSGKEVVPKEKGSNFRWPRFKMPHKYVIYDKFHRGAVFCIVSISAIIVIRIAVDAVHLNKVRNPLMHEIARLEKEEKMEKMQKEREEELNRQKKLQEVVNKV